MNTENKPLGMSVGCTMRNVFRVVKARSFEQTEAKLTIEQFRLLYIIFKKKEDVIQKDMADFMGKDKSAILRMIDLLEEKELLRRVVDNKDRRKNQILVTKKGEKAIEDHLQMELALNQAFFDGLTDSELDVFYKVLDHIRTRAEHL